MYSSHPIWISSRHVKKRFDMKISNILKVTVHSVFLWGLPHVEVGLEMEVMDKMFQPRTSFLHSQMVKTSFEL